MQGHVERISYRITPWVSRVKMHVWLMRSTNSQSGYTEQEDYSWEDCKFSDHLEVMHTKYQTTAHFKSQAARSRNRNFLPELLMDLQTLHRGPALGASWWLAQLRDWTGFICEALQDHLPFNTISLDHRYFCLIHFMWNIYAESHVDDIFQRSLVSVNYIPPFVEQVVYLWPKPKG